MPCCLDTFVVLLLLLLSCRVSVLPAHREQFSPLLRYALWVMAEIAIIGSDIQEVCSDLGSSRAAAGLCVCEGSRGTGGMCLLNTRQLFLQQWTS